MKVVRFRIRRRHVGVAILIFMCAYFTSFGIVMKPLDVTDGVYDPRQPMHPSPLYLYASKDRTVNAMCRRLYKPLLLCLNAWRPICYVEDASFVDDEPHSFMWNITHRSLGD